MNATRSGRAAMTARQKRHDELEGMKSFTEIGAALGVTHQRAQQIFDRAIKKLRCKPEARRAFELLILSKRAEAEVLREEWGC